MYDVFISHAWEDKAEFVDKFAQKARDAGLRVWYDRFSLRWGDSLRQGINTGLRGSYFGVAVLSPNFFAKEWTNYELDGLIERALEGSGRLLPSGHRLTKDDVRKYAPSLASRLALNTSLLRRPYRGGTHYASSQLPGQLAGMMDSRMRLLPRMIDARVSASSTPMRCLPAAAPARTHDDSHAKAPPQEYLTKRLEVP